MRDDITLTGTSVAKKLDFFIDQTIARKKLLNGMKKCNPC